MSYDCTIHQPEHLPWQGFWHKIYFSQKFIILDHVQFKKRHFECRNKVRNEREDFWLNVPTKSCSRDTKILNVEINYSENWIEKNCKTLEMNYGKLPYFSPVFQEIKEAYSHKHERLVDLNIELIERLLTYLGWQKEIIRSSSFNLDTRGSDLILDLCLKTGSTSYFSGQSGQEYLEREKFSEAKVELFFQKFKEEVYEQGNETFIPSLSVIDFLFRYHPDKLTETFIDKRRIA